MEEEIKSKVVKGLKWKSIQSLLTQVLQFAISIVIARRLLPEDYGLLGMLAIFMGISQTFIGSGFGAALTQKRNVTQEDYSTALFFNFGVAILMYAILWFAAPYIAEFYNQPQLVSVTRVYTLSLLMGGAMIVQNTMLSKELHFKTAAIISLISLVISGITGIVMAYTGFGVWALVYQGLASGFATLVMLWIVCRWRPSLCFSKASFKALFGYGSKILGSSLINSVYSNISTLIIGKAFAAADLGLYSRARGFATLPGGTITDIAIQVNFPVLVRYQDDNEKLLANYCLLLRAPVFLLFPTLIGMACVAHPMIYCLIGEKWLECVPMLIILCLGCIWTPLTHINLNLLYVKGRTDLVLKLELIKKPIAFAMLFAAIPFGIYGMCVSVAAYEFVAFTFNCYYTKKILNFGWSKQLKQIMPIICYCAVMSVCVLASMWFIPSQYVKLIVGIIVGAVSYVAMARANHDVTFHSLMLRIESRLSNIGLVRYLAK